MAKITLADGTVIEGTIEEFAQMGVKFPGGEVVAEEQPLKVGDYAKVVDNSNASPKLPLGTILEIKGTVRYEDAYYYRTLDGIHKGGVLSYRLVRATDEEVEEAKRQQAEKELERKWAKIGRKPNEYKVGDAVRYKNAFTTVVAPAKCGQVRINQSNHETKHIAVSPKELTLVFPVEAKFDGGDR